MLGHFIKRRTEFSQFAPGNAIGDPDPEIPSSQAARGVQELKRGAPVRCRASIGNLGEARWLAPRPNLTQGGVYLAGRNEYGLEFKAPIVTDTDYLADATVKEFTLIPSADKSVTVSFEMQAEGRAYFGERRTVTLKP